MQVKSLLKKVCSILIVLIGLVFFVLKSYASRQPGQWINTSFWHQNQTDSTLIYNLFGDGNAGSAPYTQGRDSSCIPTSVTHLISASISPGANTVFVLNSGTYSSEYLTMLGDCSAIIGSGNVTITLPAGGLTIIGRNHLIFDNITFKGTISISGSQNITFSNSKIISAQTAISATTSNHLFFANDQIIAPLGFFFDTNQATTIHNISISGQTGFSLLSSQYIAGSNILFSGTTTPITSSGTSYLSFTNLQIFTSTNYLNISPEGILSTSTGTIVFTGTNQTNLAKQKNPIRFSSQHIIENYGTDGLDYDTNHMIGEGESQLLPQEESLVQEIYGYKSILSQGWKSNSCSLGNFRFITIKPSDTLPTVLEANTIYTFLQGTYTFTKPLLFNGNCIAILGNESTFVANSSFNGNALLEATINKENLIISNVIIDGGFYAPAGIRLDNGTKNTTINSVVIKNTSTHGIYLGQRTQNNRISDTEIFNSNGIGLEISYGNENNIINTLIYNNRNEGILLNNGSNRNSISNSQIFSNSYGISAINNTTNSISSTNIYNNSKAGVSLKSASTHFFANTHIYNNLLGITFDDIYSKNNKYFGQLLVYNNTGGNIPGWTGDDIRLTKGQSTYDLTPPLTTLRKDGTISLTGSTHSCRLVSTPIIGSRSFFDDTDCKRQGQTGTRSAISSLLPQYQFGKAIQKQTVPISISGSTYITLDSLYASTKFIGENITLGRKNPFSIIFTPNELVCGSIGCEARKWYTIGFSAFTGNNITSAQLSFENNYGYGYFQVLSGTDWVNTGSTISNISPLSVRIIAQAPGATGFAETGILILSGTSRISSGSFVLDTKINGETGSTLCANSSNTTTCMQAYLNSLLKNKTTIPIDESKYIASNCKKYTIKYDSSRSGYTSPNLKYKRYFTSRDALARFIDSGNPGDCRINTYEDQPDSYDNTGDTQHITPNGRLYRIRFITGSTITSGDTTTEGTYGSPDLIKTKAFTELKDLRQYLDDGNPAVILRDHTIDTETKPFNYLAPNGRTYKIYLTDKGYMSYSFRTVKYFDFLSQIKQFIDKYNKK